MEQNTPIQICEQCRQPFQKPWKRRSRFCSARCRDKEKNSRPETKELRRVQGRAKYWANKAQHQAYMKRWRHNKRLAVLADQPWATLLTSTKQKATRIGIAHDLDEEWARNRWTGKCEVSGLPFSSPEQRAGYKLRNFCPSIDKIDPTGGYLKDNCRFVIWAVNSLKRDGSEDEMYMIAEAITNARRMRQ